MKRSVHEKMATPSRVVRQVKPLLSYSQEEARRRVLNLYRAWYRQIPYILYEYDVPVTDVQLKAQLRKEFYKHANVSDIRVIDMLVVKGQMELKETAEKWKTASSLMNYFKETVEKKPTDFLSKFISGHE